jgi:PAS domain S-box-containing protein
MLIEDVADGFYEVDLRGNFTFFNDALVRIFGYPRGALQGHNYREFMDEANAAIAFEAFNEIHRTRRSLVGIHWEITRQDGERRHLEISAKNIFDADGRLTGFRGIARDVTDKYLAEEALKESEQCAIDLSEASRRAEQRYRAFLNFLPYPVFVFNLDSTVSYLNPAFEEVFGWTLKELEGKIIPFVPDSHKAETRKGIEQLYKGKIIKNFETKRYTKDGRLLDIIVDGAIFYDNANNPAGQVVTLRDVTREKRTARVNQALFRISRALYQYRTLDARLEFITREVQDLLEVEGAMVILLDEKKKEFYFHEAAFEDSSTGQKMKEIRFPADKGVAGQVYRTGKPLLVADTSKSPYFFDEVDKKASMTTRSMLDVPIKIEERMIGVLCAVNKKDSQFDEGDVELLSAIANLVALPIENAAITEALRESYADVQSLNRAKDRVIHHLSHELKTPTSVLSASLNLLAKQLSQLGGDGWQTILERARRNLQRILDMQYQIEDILQEKDYQPQYLISALLDACQDELELLVHDQALQPEAVDAVRQRIDEIFGPREAIPETLLPGPFVKEKVQQLRPLFAHRRCRVATRVSETAQIRIPPEVLGKVVEGLVRNAVENTPDGGRVDIYVRKGEKGPELTVKDNGIGISRENQRLIFENYFTAYETMQYSTRQPYDFRAGGKGFDLLRMKIFSERYDFGLKMQSRRCDLLTADDEQCPGDIDQCSHCQKGGDCHVSGGTTVTVMFKPADHRRPAKSRQRP